MPALPPYLIEPIWAQFSALLPERKVSHPLGCHRPRIPDRVVFEKLVQAFSAKTCLWALAQIIPDARARVLEGQTHDIAPHALAPVLNDFFAAR